MAQKTPNYNLNKPGYEDFGDVDTLNENFEKIDKVLAATDPTKVTAKAEPADGDGVMIADSADGSKAKRLPWSSIKTALGKLFVPLARKINGKTLTEDVTLTGENIAVSTTDSTPISGALKYRVNPNLLDNWYFGRPVNRRGGMMVPPGVTYLVSPGGATSGVTDKYYPAKVYDSGSYVFTKDDVTYYVDYSYVVPGYCVGYSYTIDRWSVEGNIVVTLESDGISIENVGDEAGQFKQELLPDFSPEGTLLCISAIVKSTSGDARLFLSQSNSPWGHPIDFIPLQTGFVSESGNLMGGNHKFSIYLGAGAKIKLAAVKLELGDEQTLAHKENEKWVLNEIPDFGEQLRRCQRYAVDDNYHTTVGQLNYDGDSYFISVQFPCVMRTPPVITLKEISAIGWGALPIPNAEITWCDANGFFIAIKDLSSMNNFIGKACSVIYFASADL